MGQSERCRTRLYARAMQVNAGMIEAMDHHLNRLFKALEKSGQLENTIIIILSDNGPESESLSNQNFFMDIWLERQGYNSALANLGEEDSMVAIGMEWATAGAVPFSRYKFHATEGGHRVPMIIAGPGVPQRNFLRARACFTLCRRFWIWPIACRFRPGRNGADKRAQFGAGADRRGARGLRHRRCGRY